MSTYTDLKPGKTKDSEIEFQAEISVETLAEQEKHELAHFGRDLVVPGFRKGKAPEAIVREHVNPLALFEEAAESALRDAVRDIATDHKLQVLGTPHITVKELAPQKPIHFTVKYALMPEITLPDYQTIGKEIFTRENNIVVTDDEVNEAEKHIRRIIKKTKGTGGTKDTENTAEQKEEEILPELTDEIVQTLGNFKTVDDLRAELKAGLLKEKEQAAQDAKRDEIVQEIMKQTAITVPELLIEQEYERFTTDRAKELERMDTTLEKYLEDIKKSAKDLEKEERAAIERELKTSLTFQAIRDKEDISADEREIAANVAILKRRYPHQDSSSFRRNAEAYIIQEKIFKLFEPLEKETEEILEEAVPTEDSKEETK